MTIRLLASRFGERALSTYDIAYGCVNEQNEEKTDTHKR